MTHRMSAIFCELLKHAGAHDETPECVWPRHIGPPAHVTR